MTGAEKIVQILIENGVEFVAGIPGGAVLPLYDALCKSPIRHVLARHEQGAGFIAQGYARATGKIGVCIASSGPGATNLVTALADAALDSIPIVAITGQVPRDMIGTNAFQEVDTTAIVRPTTKACFLVTEASELGPVLRRAFLLAQDGRPGPVLVDVPKDIQTSYVDAGDGPDGRADGESGRLTPRDELEAAVAAVRSEVDASQRPILYIGGGIVSSDTGEWIRQLAEKNQIPVVSTLMGLGAFPSDHRLFLGMLGMHAAPYTNLLLERADLLIAVGVRFDDRAVGKASEFCPDARIVHVDIDERELGKIRRPDLSIHADLRHFLPAWARQTNNTRRPVWMKEVDEVRCDHPLSFPLEGAHPIAFLRDLGRHLKPGTIITTDVGQHQMWAAQAFPFQEPRTCITSGGLGTMGFGLPAAIGAALGKPDRTVVCISGDGSILMNVQELALLADLGLNVKVIVMNNRHLGLVRQQQSLFYEGRLHASAFGKGTDIARVARAFGIAGTTLETLNAEAVARAIDGQGPALIEVPVLEEEMVLPMVPPGAANRNMLRREDFLIAGAKRAP